MLNNFSYFLFKLKIKIKKNVDIMPGSIVSKDSIVGMNTYIGHHSFISKARIGNYCSIAPNVYIGLGEHDLDMISTNSIFYTSPYTKLTEKECVIGNDVWIGVGSIVRRGVKIGNGSVIGANSFVNSDVEPYSVVVGSPAKLIKYRFSKSKMIEIEKSNWWEYPPDIAKKLFDNIDRSYAKN